MKKIIKWKRVIWFCFGGILLAAAICLAVFLSPSRQQEYLVFQGNEELIQKTEEQKNEFIIGCSEIPQNSFVCGEAGKTAEQISEFIFEPLVSISASKQVEPKLAREVSFAADGKLVEITLQEKFFSDGSNLTAQDVLSSYMGLSTPGSAYPSKTVLQAIEGMREYQEGDASEITGIEITGANTLRISFTEASVYNLEALCVPVWKKGEASPYPIGTGPYRLELFQASQQVVLSENQQSSNPYGYHRIQFVNLPLESLKERLQDFSIDAVTVNGTSGYELMKEAGYFDIYHLSAGNYSYLSFSPQADELLRQTACAVFKRDDFIRSVRNGSEPIDGYIGAEGVTAPLKSGDAFWHLASKLGTDRLVERLRKERGEEPIKFLCLDQTKARIYYKELSEQFEAYGLKLEGVFVPDVGQAVQSGTEYDMTYYFGMDQTPEEAIKKNLFEKEEYQSFLGEQLASDYRSLYSELEKWAADRLRLLPVDAKDYYLAVSSDCREEMLNQLTGW